MNRVVHEAFVRGMLIDQFGVIHDGQALYPGTLRVLNELKALGIPVAVMTNSESIADLGPNSYGQPTVALNILRENILGAEEQLKGLRQVQYSRSAQIRLLNQELDGVRSLAAEGYVTRNRMLELERNAAGRQT